MAPDDIMREVLVAAKAANPKRFKQEATQVRRSEVERAGGSPALSAACDLLRKQVQNGCDPRHVGNEPSQPQEFALAPA